MSCRTGICLVLYSLDHLSRSRERLFYCDLMYFNRSSPRISVPENDGPGMCSVLASLSRTTLALRSSFEDKPQGHCLEIVEHLREGRDFL